MVRLWQAFWALWRGDQLDQEGERASQEPVFKRVPWLRHQWLGTWRSRFKGQSWQFKDFREYTFGDDVRHIHWKSLARTQKVYVKEFEQERENPFVFVIDTHETLASEVWDGPKWQLAIPVVSQLMDLALHNQDRISAWFVPAEPVIQLPFSHRMRQKEQILARWRYWMQRPVKWSHSWQSLQSSFQALPPKTAVIFVSDFAHYEGFWDLVKGLLPRGFQCWSFVVWDRWDEGKFPSKSPVFANWRQSMVWVKPHDRLRELSGRWRQQWIQQGQSLGVPTVWVTDPQWVFQWWPRPQRG